MKKNLLLIAALLITSGIFAQEYTIYLSGTLKGFITIQKDRTGKITITPNISTTERYGGWLSIDNSICPVLPEKSFMINSASAYSTGTKSIVIDGNTTTVTSADGKWNKTVIDGNTTTYTTSGGSWWKTVINGNTLIETRSNGSWERRVLNGNTIMRTDSQGQWDRLVVTENTLTQTNSYEGAQGRAVINGNTTTVTGGGDQENYEEVIRGNTRTVTYGGGSGYREVIEGNAIIRTSLDGKTKIVVDKQGNDIFISLTGISYFTGDIGNPEKDKIKNAIDAITQGRLKDVNFQLLVLYER